MNDETSNLKVKEIRDISIVRRRVGERMSQSYKNIPHIYLFKDINMEQAKRVKNQKEINLTYTDTIINEVAETINKHPVMNSKLDEDNQKINIFEEVNIGFAVSIPEGLIVPVIKNADQKSIDQISSETTKLTEKARNDDLDLKDVTNGTFTVTNLGMYDIDHFTAIMNPSEVGILSTGSIKEKPIVKNGEITITNIMKVGLALDHRVIDGAKGAEFLNTLKKNIENLKTK